MTDRIPHYFLSLLIGVVSFLLILGPERILGTGGSFDWPAGDLPQHIAGAYAYLDSEWSFPIFSIDTLNVPYGTNAIFTDSAPAAGLVAKVFHTITGIRFNYLGAWFFFSWLAQAMSAAFLARSLGAKRWLTIALASFMAVMFPAFLFVNGNGQLPLGSHFIILTAMGLAVALPASITRRRYVAWLCLVGLAIWTHVYLFAMCFAILSAFAVQATVKGQATRAAAIKLTASALGMATALAFVGGYFSSTTGGASGGYAFYAANLLTFVLPHYSSFSDLKGYVGPVGHYEGYTYLGVVGCVLIIWSLAIKPKAAFSFTRRHPVVCALLAAMAIYAFSYNLWAGEIQLTNLPANPPFPPFSIFRAGGRFLLPVAYLLLMGAVVLVVEWLAARERFLAIVVVASLAFVHGLETRFLQLVAYQGVRGPERTDLMAAVMAADKVKQIPETPCITDHDQIHTAYSLMWMVALAGHSFNTGYLARTAPPEHCSTPSAMDTEALNILFPSGLFSPPAGCFEVDGALLCGPKAEEIALRLNFAPSR